MNPIDEIEDVGKVESTVNILGRQVKMHTLPDEDNVQSLAVTGYLDNATRSVAIKKQVLARAIVSINGTRWEDAMIQEDKDAKKTSVDIALRKISKWQSTVVNAFYEEYEKLETISNENLKKIRDDILKKEPAGPSQKPTDTVGK